MFLRFVRLHPQGDHARDQGVFHAIGALRDAGLLRDYHEAAMKEAREWFNEELPVPDSFGGRRNTAGICWFKPDARDAIARIRIYISVLEDCGIVTDMLTSRDPGCIVYEDRYQVVAEARRWTFDDARARALAWRLKSGGPYGRCHFEVGARRCRLDSCWRGFEA